MRGAGAREGYSTQTKKHRVCGTNLFWPCLGLSLTRRALDEEIEYLGTKLSPFL